MWNVFAAPELSLQPKEWCFPVAGCVTYRGYFASKAPVGSPHGLKREGYDTYVGGVPAYSTLGWFDDPVPSTVIGYPDTEVARLIFTNSPTRCVYVQDDTTFNESFATAVEQEGVKRWVKRAARAEKLAQFEQSQARKLQFVALVLEYQGKLAGRLCLAQERRREAIAEGRDLRGDARRLRRAQAELGKPKRVRCVVRRTAQQRADRVGGKHTEQVPAFQALLAQEQGDMQQFYAAAKVSRSYRRRTGR